MPPQGSQWFYRGNFPLMHSVRASDVGIYRHLPVQGASRCPFLANRREVQRVKKYRVRWKKTGAAKQSESIRSMMPPWPGIISP